MIPRYRVWDKQTERMHIVSGIDFNDGLVSSVNIWHEGWPWVLEPDEIVLMQSTGLKDKNGVEIFEGDLVEHDDNLNGDWETFEACEVVYDKDYAQFCFKWDAGNFLTDYRNLNVIGNIYENSELLEEQ